MENIKKTSTSWKPNSANLTDSLQYPTKQSNQVKKENSIGFATSKATLTEHTLQAITFSEQCKSVQYSSNNNFMAYSGNSEDDLCSEDFIKSQNKELNEKFLFMLKSKNSTNEDTLSDSFSLPSDKNVKKESSLRVEDIDEQTTQTTKICEGCNNSSATYSSLPEQVFNKMYNNVTNNYAYYNYIIPIEKENVSQQVDFNNIIFPDNHSDESTSLEEFSDFEEIFCIGDYSNKVLMVTKDGIEVVKTKSSLENIRKVLFVLKKTAVKNIQEREYHLDDLHHDIAKAIGVEPGKLKLLYTPKLGKNLKKDYTNVQLTKMLEPYVSVYKPISQESPIKQIEVEISNEEGESSILLVIVEKQTHGSQWLGGYRDIKTDIYYHNAETQTNPKSRSYNKSPWHKPPAHSTRDTQTHPPQKDVGINLPKDHSTQMWRTDHYIQKDTDVIVIPRSYAPFRGDITEGIRERASTIIQKCWKAYKVRKHDVSGKLYSFLQLRKERETIISNRLSQSGESNQEVLKLLDMIFPYKNEDFYHLQWLLAKFGKHCEKTNNLSIISGARQSNLFRCFEKEFDIFTGVERQKLLSKFDTLQQGKKTFIDYSSSPYFKQNFDKDGMYLIETINTKSSKEFKELYILFNRENMNVEQRIEVLMLFKRLLESYEYFEMKDELLELMDRECMMLSLGVKPYHLNYMRKWEEEILFHYFKSIQCHKPKSILNPEDTNLIMRCKLCRKFKQITEYPFYLGQLEKSICKLCNSKYMAAQIPKHYSPYRKILQQIQENEYNIGCPNIYVSLLQPKCIEYLIQNIWGGRSIFTYISTPSLLRLPRWDNAQPWAPWNCILLTKDEADLHESIEDVKEFYGHKYCQVIKYRHLMALKQFKPLIEIENNFRTIWQKFPDNIYSNDKKTLQKCFAAVGDTFFI